MRSSKGLEKNGLYDRLLDSIDRELGHGKSSILEYEIVYYKDPIPKDCSGKTIIITAIPELDPLPLELKNNDT